MTSWKTIPADRYDVAVVGGGAAGMTAAIAAARAGARVSVRLREKGTPKADRARHRPSAACA